LENKVISLLHGGGGVLMEKLIREVIADHFSLRKALDGVGMDDMDDGSSMKLGRREVVVAMDAHTVDPIFFPGGDIGRLAISGTVNDVSMMGAKPIAVLDSIVVEEGFPMDDFRRILNSMNDTAKEVNVAVIGGDFKVMPKGKLDKIVITTCGVGLVKQGMIIKDDGAKPGDKVIITGGVGEHGIALLTAREGFNFETDLKSDVAPIYEVVDAALKNGRISAMKDPTRGGVAVALNEIAQKSNVSIWIDEDSLPIKKSVKSASEILGIDPLEVTCEGNALMCVNKNQARDVLEAIRKTRYGKDAEIIGTVKRERPGYVFLKTVVGGTRVIDKPLGEPVPRIC
jgi:hydrogenase expression/formation protein HypE